MGKLRSQKLRELPTKLEADLVPALMSLANGVSWLCWALPHKYGGPRSLVGSRQAEYYLRPSPGPPTHRADTGKEGPAKLFGSSLHSRIGLM